MGCDCNDRELHPLKPALKNGKLGKADLVNLKPACR